MIDTTTESLKARKVFIFPYFSFYEQLKFHELSMKKKVFITSGPDNTFKFKISGFCSSFQKSGYQGSTLSSTLLKDLRNAPPAKMLIYCQNFLF